MTVQEDDPTIPHMAGAWAEVTLAVLRACGPLPQVMVTLRKRAHRAGRLLRLVLLAEEFSEGPEQLRLRALSEGESVPLEVPYAVTSVCAEVVFRDAERRPGQEFVMKSRDREQGHWFPIPDGDVIDGVSLLDEYVVNRQRTIQDTVRESGVRAAGASLSQQVSAATPSYDSATEIAQLRDEVRRLTAALQAISQIELQTYAAAEARLFEIGNIVTKALFVSDGISGRVSDRVSDREKDGETEPA